MKQLKTTLQIAFWLSVAIVIVVTALFESKISFFGTTTQTIDINTRYTLEIICVMLTLASLPLAIKGFNHLIQIVKRREISKERKENLYCAYALIRIAMLLIVTLFDIAFYYILNNESALYCALIAAVTLLFCYPTTNSVNEISE